MSDNIPVLAGITSTFVDTPRLRQHILTCGPEGAPVVLLVHGNYSASTYYEDMMLRLAQHGFRCVAPDLRGYGWTEPKPVDARRGAQDYVADLVELLAALGIARVHLIAWSLGGGVAYRWMIDHPEQLLTVTLEAPVSPYGFGGSKDLRGTPCYPDCAGSGGGVVNPEFVRRTAEGDRSADDPNSPRNVISTFYYHAGFRAEREEDYLTAALQEKIGDQYYPGDFVPSPNWPNVAPGIWGPINSLSPCYMAGDVPDMLAAGRKPPVLWIRGANDQIVSDASLFDFGTLGKLGLVPGWPGEDIYPPQPMVGQTRAVLEEYQQRGGRYRELVIEDCGHSSHIEYPDQWLAAFLAHAGTEGKS